MIQIGIEPKRLLKELKQNEISAVVSDMPVYKGIEIFVADSQTKIVKDATDSRQIGVKLEGLVVSSDKKSGRDRCPTHKDRWKTLQMFTQSV